MRWLTLLLSLPPTPSRHRVGVWRKLKRLGAVKLRGAAWILPETPEATEAFQWLVQEVQSFRGEATLLRVDRIDTMSDAQLTSLFHAARAAEYQAVIRGCREVLAQLDRHRAARRGPVDPIKARLEALKRELERVRTVDYLEAPIGRRARALWETAAKRLRAAEARPRAATPRRHGTLPPPGSTWVTRPRPHIDRIASAWLIKRFLDHEARFEFADQADAATKGISARSPRSSTRRTCATASSRGARPRAWTWRSWRSPPRSTTTTSCSSAGWRCSMGSTTS